ncbi:MAG: radical SAM family heme chaperone HemW [Clostridiales bacterium]|jgi:oxygen-independent coproporphyrinogen-3 oxidase|nr:radical SAM family heme chaperone HemW [Clostridiales bacterium]
MAGIYVHVPFCKKKCGYCDFFSLPFDAADADEYIGFLLKEAALYGAKLRREGLALAFDTVYLGGGTPSLLSADGIGKILEGLDKNFDISKSAEITAEGNPSDFCDKKKVGEFKAAGVNRLSIGIQTMHGDILKLLGREQTEELNKAALDAATCVFQNVSADVMLGLPGDSESRLKYTLDAISVYDIKHISAYALKVEEKTPLDKKIREGIIAPPDDDASVGLYDLTLGYLKERGFTRYEISNFSKPGYECRHNLNYWRRGEYVGLGPAAHGFFGGERYDNPRDLKEYYSAISRGIVPSANVIKIAPKEALFEKIMLGLRLAEGIDAAGINAEFGVDFFREYSGVLTKYGRCFNLSKTRLSVKDEFFYVINSLLTEFL